MSSVKVAVRVRPFNQRELNLKCSNIIQMNGRRTCIKNPKCVKGEDSSKDFTFDHSYWSFNTDDAHFASQSVVFQNLGEGIVSDAIDGYNSCIFAYGQTGSGKTHTMMGEDNSQGLIPRICERIFQRMDTLKKNSNSFSYKTEISYLEIYNEHVRDLLVDDEFDINGNSKHCLKVREHPKYGPYVENLSKHLVYSYQDILQLMSKGNKNRTTASTNMNDISSRSHAIFTILFSKASYVANNPYETVSKINLVDLAGSERANSTNAQGQRLIEGSHINKSLVTLGNVISSLAENCKKNKKKVLFIPYRDSTLTWLLKDSLGGNSKTVMIATISPADVNYAETLNTLRYANRAKNIVNKPQINEDPNTKLIRELREEIDRLTSMINQNPRVHERVHENQVKLKELTEEWMSKWDEIKTILTEKHSIALRKSGDAGVVLDSERPHLIVCVDDDLLSTGVTLYQLNEGDTYIGTNSAERRQDIVLNTGTDVESEHCYITWNVDDHTVTLHPINNSLCFVNNCPCDGPTVLHQGSLVVLGENNMFRFSNPMEVKHLLLKSTDLNSVDIFALNRNHLIGSTSYDSLYNSISSLNKKHSVTASNESDQKTIADCTALHGSNSDEKVDQCLNQLEFIKSFLIEFKNRLPNHTELRDRNESELLLETLLKVGAEKQISKEDLLQLLSLITSSSENERKSADNTTERVICRINNYLADKIAEIKGNSCIAKCSSPNDVIERNDLDLTGEDDMQHSQLLELSKEIDSHLTDLKSHVFNLSIDDQTECCCENMPNHSNSSLDSSILNGNILDELVEAEVQRRLRMLESPNAFSTPKRQLDLSFVLINGNLCEELDEIIIYVSSFHLQHEPEEHVLFEVKININGDKWTVYRRYRCFLQLKKDIANQYGRYIQMPYFPPRFFFNKNHNYKSLEMRRRYLENFIQRVLDSCKALPKCPLNHHSIGLEHLTRDCLYRFNNFFRVNTFSDKETW